MRSLDIIAAIVAPLAAQSASTALAGTVRQVTAEPRTMLAIGERMERAGDTRRATLVYRALAGDPDRAIRAGARSRLAKMAMQRKDWREAAQLLRAVVDEVPSATGARLALAQVLVEIGDEGAALRQLRAAQSGALPIHVARMVDRFSEALRVRRPFGANIEIALAPDSNINTATDRSTLGTVLGDFIIDEGSLARSGTGVALRGQAFVRRPLGEAAIVARASGSADLYRRKRFDRVTADLAVGPELVLGKARLSAEVGATRQLIGFEAYQNRLRAGLDAGYPLTRTTYLRAGAAIARIDNKRNDLEDGRALSGTLSLEQAIGASSGLALAAWGERGRMRDDGYSLRSWRVQLLGYRDIGRTTLTLSGTVGGLRADERLVLFDQRREERYRAVAIGAQFRGLARHGLAPFVRLNLERNRSTIDIYDYARRRAEFGVSRAF